MSIIDIVQTVGIALTLLLTILQLRMHTNSLRVSISSTIGEWSDGINKDLMDSPDLITKFSESYPGQEKIKANDKRPFVFYRILNFYSTLYFYRKQGYVDETTWRAWTKGTKKILTSPYGSGFWKDVRLEFEDEFQTFIDNLVD